MEPITNKAVDLKSHYAAASVSEAKTAETAGVSLLKVFELQFKKFEAEVNVLYLEKAFDGTPWRPMERLPVAKELGETSLMFLVHPTLTAAEIDKTCDVIQSVMQRASR